MVSRFNDCDLGSAAIKISIVGNERKTLNTRNARIQKIGSLKEGKAII